MSHSAGFVSAAAKVASASNGRVASEEAASSFLWRLRPSSVVLGCGSPFSAMPSSSRVPVAWSMRVVLAPRRRTLVFLEPMKLVSGSSMTAVSGSLTSGSSHAAASRASRLRVLCVSWAAAMCSAATPRELRMRSTRLEMEKPQTTIPQTAMPTSSTIPTS